MVLYFSLKVSTSRGALLLLLRQVKLESRDPVGHPGRVFFAFLIGFTGENCLKPVKAQVENPMFQGSEIRPQL